MIDESYVYTRIGMALVSAQRVEFIAGQLLDHLKEFDEEVYGITPAEFLDRTRAFKRKHKTLGDIFTLLKLNPKLVIEDELDKYKDLRNTLAHNFWKEYLNTKTEHQTKRAIDFCNEFREFSTQMESFFKGFTYFLALRHVKDRDHLDLNFKKWDSDFEYFMSR